MSCGGDDYLASWCVGDVPAEDGSGPVLTFHVAPTCFEFVYELVDVLFFANEVAIIGVHKESDSVPMKHVGLIVALLAMHCVRDVCGECLFKQAGG